MAIGDDEERVETAERSHIAASDFSPLKVTGQDHTFEIASGGGATDGGGAAV